MNGRRQKAGRTADHWLRFSAMVEMSVCFIDYEMKSSRIQDLSVSLCGYSRLDLPPPFFHDLSMENIPSEVLADMKRATELALSGKKDREFELRVQMEAKKTRADILRKQGILEIGVSAIRELRDR